MLEMLNLSQYVAKKFFQGFVKINNFKKKKNKISHFQYIITPKRNSERTKLTIDFMTRKMREYDDLKKELD